MKLKEVKKEEHPKRAMSHSSDYRGRGDEEELAKETEKLILQKGRSKLGENSMVEGQRVLTQEGGWSSLILIPHPLA